MQPQLTRPVVLMFAWVLIALALLGFRQRRIVVMHEVATVHGQIGDARHDLWAYQARFAAQTNPEHLRLAATDAGLGFESSVVGDGVDHQEPARRVVMGAFRDESILPSHEGHGPSMVLARREDRPLETGGRE